MHGNDAVCPPSPPQIPAPPQLTLRGASHIARHKKAEADARGAQVQSSAMLILLFALFQWDVS
jgi:hypothetical protein